MKLTIFAVAILTMVPSIFSAKGGPSLDHTFMIRHYGTTGHGCAVKGKTLTNRHMVDPRRSSATGPPQIVYFRWEFPNGQEGVGKSEKISNTADLAEVKLNKEPINGYATIGKRPAIGDEIYWEEYNFEKRSKIFVARARSGKVITIFTGHVILEADVTSGASGGCAVNEEGEAIGLIAFGVTANDGKEAAGIVGFWGDWWEDFE